MPPSNSSGDFQREYLVRLPLPLAQLYSRAHNSPSSRARHDNSFYLFEALIKLSAAPLVGAYLGEIEAGAPRAAALDRLLAQLALPSLGQWVGILRETARHFGTRPEAVSHPLGHVWQQLNAKRRSPSAALELFRRIKNGPDGQPAGDESSSLLELFDALVLYRNTVFGHGAGRSEEFYETEMGPLLFPAASDILSEGVLDLLGPRGSRLVHISELRVIDEQRVELVLSELVGLQSERMAPVELTPAEAAAVTSNCVAVLWPGRKVPLRLDPLLVFRGAEFADEVRFLNRDRSGKQVEYLSYTTGKTERDKSMVPAMARLLSRVTGRTVEESELDRLAQQSLAETPAIDALLPPTAPTQRTVGDYEILAELGRGGMGVVYLARQLSLGRLVALKMLPASLSGDEMALARFRREMRALGRCEHPHIVKVLASGTLPDGQIYYAMEYVPGADLEMVWRELSGQKRVGEASTLGGLTLAEAVLTATRKQRDEVQRHSEAGKSSTALAPEFGSPAGTEIPSLPLLPPLPSLPAADGDAGGYMRRVAQLMRDAALAVQSVHDQEIVHRDIKPANLMLTPDGSRVVLMDFGLAKSQSLALTKTSSGEFLGTLRYAAPEQLAAAKVRVDRRVDVRALGTTLWELLTRQQAFGEAEDQSQLASWVLNRDLPQLRTMDPSIDRDLEAIVARAVERDPERRIQTARELAEYLDLYLRGKPLPIRTPGPMELLGRWVREHRALVGVAAAACIAVILTVMVAFISILDSRGKAIVARNDAVTARNTAREEEKKAIDARNQALDLAAKNKKLAEQERAANEKERLATESEKQQRKRADAKAEEAKANEARAVSALALADQRLYVSTLGQAQIALESEDATRLTQLIAAVEKPPQSGPDPRGWEWYYLNGIARNLIRTFATDGCDASSVALSPDGRLLAIGSAAKYKPLKSFGDTSEPELLQKGTVRLFDARSGKLLHTLLQHTRQIPSMAFTPDGKHLIATQVSEVHRWDVQTGQEVPLGFKERAYYFSLRPDGRRMAAFFDGRVRIWDLNEQKEVSNFSAKPPGLESRYIGFGITYNPDGTLLMTLGDTMQHLRPEASKRIYDAGESYHAMLLDADTGDIRSIAWGAGGAIAFSPGGDRFVTGFSGKAGLSAFQIRFWDTASAVPILAPRDDPGRPTGIVFTPNGRHVFVVGDKPEVYAYDAVTGGLDSKLPADKRVLKCLDITPDGQFLAAGDYAGNTFLWRIGISRQFNLFREAGRDVALHGERKLLVSGSGPAVRIWSLETGRHLRDIKVGDDSISGLDLSPDGKQVAVRVAGQTAVYHVDDGQRRADLQPPPETPKPVRPGIAPPPIMPAISKDVVRTPVFGAPQFSRDGRWLAAPGPEGKAIRWDARTGKIASVYDNVKLVAFSPDGKSLATDGPADRAGIVPRIWSISGDQPPRAMNAIKGLPNQYIVITCLAFDTAGQRLAAGLSDGTVAVWTAASGEMQWKVHGHDGSISDVLFTPDGKRLITASADTTVKFWDATNGTEIFTLHGHRRGANGIAMSQDGRYLATSGDDGDVLVRDLRAPLGQPPAQPIELASEDMPAVLDAASQAVKPPDLKRDEAFDKPAAERLELGQKLIAEGKETDRGFRLIRSAAYDGNIEAKWVLSQIYAEGKVVPRHDGAAFSNAIDAARQGHVNAQFFVGQCYEEGRGVKAEFHEAMQWYMKARQNNHPEAEAAFRRLIENRQKKFQK